MTSTSLSTSDEVYWWQSSTDDYSSLSPLKESLSPDEREILSKPLIPSARDGTKRKQTYDSDSLSTFNAEHGTEEEQAPTLKYLVISILALTGITTSVASIAFATGFGLVSGPALYMVVGGGVLTSVMSPIMLSNEKAIVKANSIRKTINKLRAEVKNLTEENKKLAKNNDDLEEEVGKLKGFEDALDGIITKSGKSVLHFVKLVKEFEQILKDKQSVVKTLLLQDLIALLIKNDSNKNFEIDASEMDQLYFALETYGVYIDDKETFTKEALMDPSIDSVLIKVRKCLDGQNINANNVMDLRDSTLVQSVKLSM